MLKNRVVIEPGLVERQYWHDLWRYRDLFVFLAWRDILVRYKQTIIGILWALAKPLVTMLVFSFVFSKLANLPSDGVPYPILVFTALLPWQFFANAFSGAGESLVNNSGMISKVYFPRLIVPASALVVSFVDFIISAIILVGLMVWYGHLPGIRILFLPLFLMLAIFAALSAGLWIAALNVKYRDFRIIIPFMVQFGLYISPVGFTSSIVPADWRFVYSLNPMVGVIDGFRWAILGGDAELYIPGIAISTSLIVLLFLTGLRYFRSVEKTFADVI